MKIEISKLLFVLPHHMLRNSFFNGRDRVRRHCWISSYWNPGVLWIFCNAVDQSPRELWIKPRFPKDYHYYTKIFGTQRYLHIYRYKYKYEYYVYKTHLSSKQGVCGGPGETSVPCCQPKSVRQNWPLLSPVVFRCLPVPAFSFIRQTSVTGEYAAGGVCFGLLFHVIHHIITHDN